MIIGKGKKNKSFLVSFLSLSLSLLLFARFPLEKRPPFLLLLESAGPAELLLELARAVQGDDSGAIIAPADALASDENVWHARASRELGQLLLERKPARDLVELDGFVRSPDGVEQLPGVFRKRRKGPRKHNDGLRGDQRLELGRDLFLVVRSYDFLFCFRFVCARREMRPPRSNGGKWKRERSTGEGRNKGKK